MPASSSGARKAAGCFSTLADPDRSGPLIDMIDHWIDPDSETRARRRFGPAGGGARRPRRIGRALFRQPCRGVGRDSLAPRRRKRGRAAPSTARSADRPIGRLVDIGTGTGRMIELFAPQATAAIGIDRSSEMLRLARAKLEAVGIGSAGLRQGDMYALPLDDGSADSVIIHQVLHYAQSPRAAIAEAARILAPGRTPAGGRFRGARARGIADPRRPFAARLRRRGDDRLVRGGRACRRSCRASRRAAS